MKKLLQSVFAVLMMSGSSLYAQEGVFFSEYAEGSSNNKYLEIYNNTLDTVNLDDYMFVSCSNGCTVEGEFEYDNTSSIAGGKIAPGDVFVVAHPSAEPNILAKADGTYTYFSNGDDWMALLWAVDSSIVDAIGIPADVDSISAWAVAGVANATGEHTLYRKPSVMTGNMGNWAASAGTDTVNSEWVVGDRPDGTFLSSDYGMHKANVQRVFQAGDLAIVGYRCGANTIDDEFALLTFVDIPEGTKLHITDMMYTENGIAQCDGGLVWTAPAGVKSGDVILVGNDLGVVDTGAIEGSTFGLSKKGDQVIIYEGPRFNANHITALSTNAWSASGITACKGGESMLPSSLTNGTNAISHEMTTGNESGNTINAVFTGDQSGTIAEVKARVFDYNNWNGVAADSDQVWPEWKFMQAKEPTFLFKPGDMAIVGYRMNASTPDEFALLTFVDIPEGAVLYFTDDKYAQGAQCDGGDLVWTAPAGGIKAGTVFSVLNDNPDVELGSVTGGSFGLSSGGDQIIIFEGTYAKPNHITALSSNQWETSGIDCTTKSSSELPAGLTNGENAISHEMTNGNDAGNTVNAYYTGTMEGTFDEIKKLVYDYNNWNGSAAGTEAQQWPTWNFTGVAASVNSLGKFGFNMWPNPANDVVYFNTKIHARVLTLNGVVVLDTEEEVSSIDVSSLNAGFYLIQNQFGATQKLIVE